MNRIFYLILLIVAFDQVNARTLEPIKIGMTAALSGSVSELGIELRTGIETYFNQINSTGGFRNRPLKLIVYDDGYEPLRAAANMRKLVNEDKVLATIGNVGTPTAIVTVPIALKNKTLIFGAFSGGAVLRPVPANRYIINYRASYAQETGEIINNLLSNGVKPEKIAFFTQRDGFGDAIYNSAIHVLHEKGVKQTEVLVHGRYERNTNNVEDAVAMILEADPRPEVVVMAGSYKPSAKFITLLQQQLPDTWFINISFVGSALLKRELDNKMHHIVVTQVVPGVYSSLPIVDEYIQALKAYAPTKTPNDVSLEGYIIAKLFYQGLQNISGEISRESIIDGLEQIHNLDIGLRSVISYDENDHQGMKKIWPVCLDNDHIEPFDWKKIKAEGQE